MRNTFIFFIIVFSGLACLSQANQSTEGFSLSRLEAVKTGKLPWHLDGSSPDETAKSAIRSTRMREGDVPVVVAVIDSGLVPGHPALESVVLPGYNMASTRSETKEGRSADTSPDPRDAKCLMGNGVMASSARTHGTEISSLIAGNGFDYMWGVSPTAKILPVRLFGACPVVRRDMLDAIEWAAGLKVEGVPENKTPARVINMSFTGGSSTCGPDLQASIDKVVQRGVFVVAAAGNTFKKALKEPANCKGVISVGSIDAENAFESYSALDPRTTLYAPGGGKRLDNKAPWALNKLRISTFELDFLGKEKSITKFAGVGTSYAAGIVSGWLALWLSQHPQKTPSDFFTEMPNFLQDSQPIADCAACNPKGIVSPESR